MNCLDVRRTLGAEPKAQSPALEAHLAECAACAAHAAELLRFDALIGRALEIGVPPAADRPQVAAVAPVARFPARRTLALAASLVGVAVLVATFLTLQPREALASAVVGHAGHEPAAWARTGVAVAPDAVKYVLARSGVALAPGVPLITYASSCAFRGWQVPHLVVQTPSGPMTVMLLTHERVTGRTVIDEAGYRGLVMPAAWGAFAVLSRDPVDAATLDAIATEIMSSVRATG